jgi:hypothetical protein
MVLKDRINENDQYKITDKSIIQIIIKKTKKAMTKVMQMM